MTDPLDRRHIDERIEEHIAKEEACMSEMKEDVKKISDALFGEDGIVPWAKEHIEAERERKELFKELKKKLIVRGTLGAFAILLSLLWLGFKEYFHIGGN